MFSFISLTQDEIAETVILKFKGPAAQSSPLINKIVRQGFQCRRVVEEAKDEIHLTLKINGKSLEECKKILKNILETFSGQNLATEKPEPRRFRLQQTFASDDKDKYIELFSALQSGEEKALDTFKLLPQDQQKRIWEQFTGFPEKTLLHAAIDGGLLKLIVQIIQLDKALRPEGPPLTAFGLRNPGSYIRNKIYEYEDDLKASTNRKYEQKEAEDQIKILKECHNNLINEPIDNSGNTYLHSAIYHYRDASKADQNETKQNWLATIRRLVARFNADFTVKNKAGKSPLDLVLEGDYDEILILFLDNDKDNKSQRITCKLPQKCLLKLSKKPAQIAAKEMWEVKRFLDNHIKKGIYPQVWDQFLHQIAPSHTWKEVGVIINANQLNAETHVLRLDNIQDDVMKDGEFVFYEITVKYPDNYFLIEFFEKLKEQIQSFQANWLRIKSNTKDFSVTVLSPSYINQNRISNYWTMVHRGFRWTTVLNQTLAECQIWKTLSQDYLIKYKADIVTQVLTAISTRALCQIIAEYCWEFSFEFIPGIFREMLLKIDGFTLPRGLKFNNTTPALETCLNTVLQEEKTLEVYSSTRLLAKPNIKRVPKRFNHNLNDYQRFFVFASPQESNQSALNASSQVELKDCKNVMMVLSNNACVTYPNPYYKPK